MKRRVFEVLEVGRPGDRLSQAVDVAIALLIVLNVLALLLGTVEEVYQKAPNAFLWFEAASVIVFTLEYVARVWACTSDPRYSHPLRGRLRFMATPLSLIDAAAILPFYVVTFVATGTLDLRVLRVMRLVARAARLARYSSGIRTLAAAISGRSQELLTTVGLLAVLLVLASSLMYVAEHSAQPDKFSSIPHAMWWSIITLTTVGYGDVAPITTTGRLIAGLIAVLGIGLFAVPAGILGSSFLEQIDRRRSRETRVCPHCGEDIHADG